ncbi:hypothetical protein [Pseudoxanthomonas winnipegensis]|uniref:Uncharacterized protein n=1 Tax=Pseudoxanthomonas winnipegensis TaxID=2480810 RepID=A0A4Q8M3B9_9GAMM|nr:hypothetical protein [Pseudoxanthomonas winnipegensis]TAA41482.1 hypothetical protein EA655_11080 [Pseudoxanthomonas winnipegensis]
MPAFDSIVNLCRLSRACQIAGANLLVQTEVSAEIAALIDSIEAGGRRVTTLLAGKERPLGVGGIDHGTTIELQVHGVSKTNEVVAQNVGALISYNMGRFQVEAPETFYLIQEDYALGEGNIPKVVASYLRCIEFAEILKRVGDDFREGTGEPGTVTILTGRKLSIPLTYSQWLLDDVPMEEALAQSRCAIFEDHLKIGRLDAMKRVLVRFLFNVTPKQRFEVLVKSWDEIMQAFLSDFDIYASGFNFDKAREDFERRKLDFVVKMNSTSSDAMTKLIAIPVGQGLLASQMKTDAAYAIVNHALLTASFVFLLVAAMLVTAHILTLRQVGSELRAESDMLRQRAMPTYTQLRPMIEQLQTRLRFHQWGVPIVMSILLIVTTGMTLVAFLELTGTT